MNRHYALSALWAAVMVTTSSLVSATEPSSLETAIVHGKLLTITHGIIDNGTVIIADGKIKAVGGPETSVPPHARVLDASGMTV